MEEKKIKSRDIIFVFAAASFILIMFLISLIETTFVNIDIIKPEVVIKKDMRYLVYKNITAPKIEKPAISDDILRRITAQNNYAPLINKEAILSSLTSK